MTADPDGGTDGVLTAADLTVYYGKVRALSGVDLTLNEGEIVSLIGPNGAGKTTFADTAMGFLDYSGSIQYRGVEVADYRQSELVSEGMIYCTEKRDLFPFMSVKENLRMGAYRSRDVYDENLSHIYELFPRLEERDSQKAYTMSGGEQQMLAIGRAMMGEPDLLIIDEPTLGLAPVIVQDISEAFTQIAAEGVSILLTEQNFTFALEHADRIYLLENGRILKSGAAETMEGDTYIRETYLGGSA